MRKYKVEPVRGLPGRLPPGESILWQGAPDWWTLAKTAFHVRAVAAYFVLLALFGFAAGSPVGAVTTLVAGLACLALLFVLAFATARMSIYTLTDRRVVLRIGVALPKYLNLPLVQVESVDLRRQGGGRGDVALVMSGATKLGYLLLWPHARPFQLRRPIPMLRAVPDAEAVAARLAAACTALTVTREIERAAPAAAAPVQPQLVAA